MRFTCPSCSKSYRLTRDHLGASGGAKIKCPNCKTVVRVKLGDGETLIATLAAASGAIDPALESAASEPLSPAAVRKTADVASSAPIWHVAVGKSAQGPMTVGQIQSMIDAGKFGLDALGWRKGMANWAKLATIAELRGHLREALRGPRADPAGVDPSGNAPTVMADVISVPETAESFHGASTLKPTAASHSNAALPRTRADAPGLAASQSPATSAQRDPGTDNPVSGGRRPPSQVVAVQPRRAPSTAAEVVQGSPGQSSAGQSSPGQSSPGQSDANQRAAASVAAATSGAKQAAGKTDAKPEVKTGGLFRKTGSDKGAPAAKAQPMFPSASGGSSKPSLASASSFFDSGDAMMGDIELDLPDPNKHKPSKEEYQNLLQEFSVMFRLDKRSKRQKVGIAVVLSLLVVGVFSFGIILYLQGQQRQALIRDSKTILAVFSLDYQTSVTVNLTREAEEEAEKSGGKVKGGPAGLHTTSKLAEQLRVKIREKRTQAESGKPRIKNVAVNAGSGAAPKLTKEEQATIARMQAERMAEKLANVGGRSEIVVPIGGQSSQVTKTQLRGLCSAAAPDLRGCAERIAGGSSFTAVVHINTAGNIDRVDALVAGKRDGELSDCATNKMSKKRFGVQDEETRYSCEVN